jgi:hypothetical protein
LILLPLDALLFLSGGAIVMLEEGAPLLTVRVLSLADPSLVVTTILSMRILFFAKPHPKIFPHYS